MTSIRTFRVENFAGEPSLHAIGRWDGRKHRKIRSTIIFQFIFCRLFNYLIAIPLKNMNSFKQLMVKSKGIDFSCSLSCWLTAMLRLQSMLCTLGNTNNFSFGCFSSCQYQFKCYLMSSKLNFNKTQITHFCVVDIYKGNRCKRYN